MNLIHREQWKEFADAGLVWWINLQLHLFGWCIEYVVSDNGNIEEVYPRRTNFRGFPEYVNDKGYKILTRHINENIGRLEMDVDDGT